MDYWVDKKDNTMGTRIGLREGEEVILAWHAGKEKGDFEDGDEWFEGLMVVGPNRPGIPGSGPGSGVAGWIWVIRHFFAD